MKTKTEYEFWAIVQDPHQRKIDQFMHACDVFEKGKKLGKLDNVTIKITDKIKSNAEKRRLWFEIDLNDIIKKNIYSDQNMLSRVIFNVLENAVKFTEIGSIRLKVFHPDIDFVKNQGFEIPQGFNDKSYLLFKVTDTGMGISEEEIVTIFDEYNMSDRNIAKKHGGTGFKLALTRKILLHLGGIIWVESELGQGSTLSFIIPIEKPEQNI